MCCIKIKETIRRREGMSDKEKKCDLRICPMFIGLFLEGQKMSGQAKEAINKKLLKWFKMGKRLK